MAKGVAEDSEKYYLDNAKNNKEHINNVHDKIFREILNNKKFKRNNNRNETK